MFWLGRLIGNGGLLLLYITAIWIYHVLTKPRLLVKERDPKTGKYKTYIIE
jgi:hypothetical protein